MACSRREVGTLASKPGKAIKGYASGKFLVEPPRSKRQPGLNPVHEGIARLGRSSPNVPRNHQENQNNDDAAADRGNEQRGAASEQNGASYPECISNG